MCQSGSWWGTLRWWYSHFLENWNVKIDANNSNTFSIFCNIHIVWKLLKMSHLNFWNLAFSTNFCPTKTDLSGNTFWPQALVFQKLAKMDHFWYFWLTFVHSKYKHSSLRSQYWMRLTDFHDFSFVAETTRSCYKLRSNDEMGCKVAGSTVQCYCEGNYCNSAMPNSFSFSFMASSLVFYYLLN